MSPIGYWAAFFSSPERCVFCKCRYLRPVVFLMLCLNLLFMKKINRRNGTCNFQGQQSELWYASVSQPMRLARSRFPVFRFLVGSFRCLYFSRLATVKEVVKATILEQGPPNQKHRWGLCLHPPPPLPYLKRWFLYCIATPLSSSKK